MSTSEDRDLGMHRGITRRDFVNGVGVAVGGSLAAPGLLSARPGTPHASPAQDDYPPALTGMRGTHPGSYEVAHSMRDGESWDTGEDTNETYDMVIVGAGMSGLGAAYYFRRQAGPDAKILLLDNHDDFGGHARRNEFQVRGRLLIARGGTMYIERPATFTPEGRQLLEDIGVDYGEPTYERGWDYYQSLGMESAQYFDKETFGVDQLLTRERAGAFGFTGGPSPEFLAETPLSEHVKRDLLRLYNGKSNYLAGLSPLERDRLLKKTSYKDYLLNHVQVHPDVLEYFHPGGGGCPSLTIETYSAWFAFKSSA